MSKSRIGATLCVLSLSVGLHACSTLIVRDTDSAAAKAAKVSSRVVLGVATLSYSEWMVWATKQDEEREARGGSIAPAAAALLRKQFRPSSPQRRRPIRIHIGERERLRCRAAPVPVATGVNCR